MGKIRHCHQHLIGNLVLPALVPYQQLELMLDQIKDPIQMNILSLAIILNRGSLLKENLL